MFHPDVSLELLNTKFNTNMTQHLGIEFTEIGSDFLSASMPVDSRTQQPFGMLHGGASVVLAESLGSAASNMCVDPKLFHCVGLEINANHLRPVESGKVYGKAIPLHLGKKTHVWDIKIVDEKDRLVCISRLTVAVVQK